ncbi:VCBS domain-containing protein [Massilia agilis]|uniref:VCBS domain-containing protein n=1 Tax=Massilia agilis TaxID=1811226 RepID=A0ABT2DCC1_9BURK|nr:VCBS domain-containing protein [Massilia agilis]MCS0808959.1 VCBS domain-containing protein [Massilia agilis]
MATQTSVKVATLTGAAKDDLLTSAATGLTEDNLSAKLNVLDNDPGAAKLYSLVQNVSSYSATAQFPVATSAVLASGASITINADGTVGYDASALRASLQSYAEGETFTDSFVYTVRMANGALSTATVTVKIAGANDAPTLASVATVALQDSAADDTPAAITGTLAGHDVDHGSVLTYSLADSTQGFAGTYGQLVVDSKTGAYSFLADADQIDALAAGETANASFTVVARDEHGAASAPVTLSFNLVGANDTASITGNGLGAVGEDGTLSAAASLAVHDRDHGQSVFAAAPTLTGTYGDFSFDKDTGAWSYQLRNGDANVQALNGGKVVSDEIVVSSLDGTASATLHVDVTGANDAATIGGNATGAVGEDATLAAQGVLTVQDVDAGEAAFAAPVSLAGTYGDFSFNKDTGEWSYLLRNGDANVQALNAGDVVFDKLQVSSLDGSASQTITVSVAGAAEAAPAPAPNPVTTFTVNHGLSDINGRIVFNGFDGNDLLAYSSNYVYLGHGLLDTNGDGVMDASTATFEFSNNGGKHSVVEVVLVGYTALTDAQVTH